MRHIHAQDTGTTADIQDNFVLEDVAVLVDRVTVGASTDIVFLFMPFCGQQLIHTHGTIRKKEFTYQHLLVNACARIEQQSSVNLH